MKKFFSALDMHYIRVKNRIMFYEYGKNKRKCRLRNIAKAYFKKQGLIK